ncbi:SpoIIE family protein phosphatase [Streptomyces acidiscabies]|uniref:SpoIIE family protein phosphatase n=6 Tax=Streptomyces acidiscabies TaxID=42234 RepID=A0AAP6EKG5_9ACTN|nr:SpoIIE family protein phosphatase [Streptomyces acidiscabies]MBP5940067.1 fused response regulator/phosphatase [Streptomyces sp. LBUM 1476]MBZ3911267.1 SpoIIE family protein phosphatase [Streptomyces acidiscabies]MDX2965570.1 SpoIIE family protein phosphatase [Streptomyces acidiscabies]MDX3025110.1 SpoIIE family protein phosphatase [Streptomyces acidiscabies]MDX3795486.1 SpoIIE family protein phosphatase [Streptomyces acidiscabies]
MSARGEETAVDTQQITENDAGATVLVVDDVAASRYAMGAVLRRAGHRVVDAASGYDALREVSVRLRAGTPFDVALVDVGLPDMSGFELCRRLKATPGTERLPIVHFSAAAVAPSDRCRGLDVGGEAYLTVPADPLEIQAVVRAALRGARTRGVAEEAARRLAILAESIVTVQGARDAQELADAAAEGAARLSGTPAVVFVIGARGEVYRGLPRGRSRVVPPDASADETVVRLVTRLAEGRGGTRTVVVPGALWPPGYFRRGARDDARLILAPAPAGRTPVCVATPAPPAHAPDGGDDGLLARLAQATALAAEPLLMYQVERHVALTLQHSFLPRPASLPKLPGVDVEVRYVPASLEAEIGGDFYAALPTDSGVLTAVGDVVGHSLHAATVMVEIRHALRAYCVEDDDPGTLAARLDRMLQRYHPDFTATVCLALIDPDTGKVRIANAGHLPPLVVTGDSAEYVDAAGPLLGLGLPRPDPTEFQLRRGQRLLMVTDGLIETRGTDLATSLARLRTAAAGAPDGLGTLCDLLLGCFADGREDDIAMLALRLR